MRWTQEQILCYLLILLILLIMIYFKMTQVKASVFNDLVGNGRQPKG
jgi:hypothetical protein